MIFYVKKEMDGLKNRTVLCHDATKITSEGVWNGRNPLSSAVPLLLTQLILITLTSKAFEFLLQPLGQCTIVAQIIVSSLLANEPYQSLLVGSQSLVAFPAIACVLAELKIFNTEVGRLAVAVAMFYDLLALGSCAFGFAYFETRDQGLGKVTAAIMSVFGLILGAVIVIRLILRFVISEKATAPGHSSSTSNAPHPCHGQ